MGNTELTAKAMTVVQPANQIEALSHLHRKATAKSPDIINDGNIINARPADSE